jgi:hypothetical protein
MTILSGVSFSWNGETLTRSATNPKPAHRRGGKGAEKMG